MRFSRSKSFGPTSIKYSYTRNRSDVMIESRKHKKKSTLLTIMIILIIIYNNTQTHTHTIIWIIRTR